jgi:hypothetical protein
MAYNGIIYAVRAGVKVYREPDGRVEVQVLPGTLPLSVAELGMLDDLRRDAVVGVDGCGQWRAWQARWDGQHWCCPTCGQVLTFPF